MHEGVDMIVLEMITARTNKRRQHEPSARGAKPYGWGGDLLVEALASVPGWRGRLVLVAQRSDLSTSGM